MNEDKIILYHSHYAIIEYPAITKSKFTKDFSWGFYCTPFKSQAERLASRFNTPTVNVYVLKNIYDLNVKQFDRYCNEWLDFVVSCRNGNTHNYDVVIGPMADDTIYDYLEAYYHGQMNKQLFFESMKFNYPETQISIHTIKALNSINYLKSYRCNN